MASLSQSLRMVVVSFCILIGVIYFAVQTFLPAPVYQWGNMSITPLYSCFLSVADSGNNSDNSSSNNSVVAGNVHLHMWRCRQYVGFTVDSMRIQKDWPLHPNTRAASTELKHKFDKLPNHAFKMFGLLMVHVDGDYQFQMTRSSTAALSLEFWLSDTSDPRNISKRLQLACPESHRDCTEHPESKPITLKKDSAYYYEFHMKAFDGDGDVELKWRTPDGTGFVSIPSENLQLPVNDSKFDEALAGPLPSNQLQVSSRMSYVTNKVYNITELQVLPECTFDNGYGSDKKVEKYKGIYMVFESKVYPKEPSTAKKEKESISQVPGNRVIPDTSIQHLVQMYKDAFRNSTVYKGTVLGARYVEETEIKKSGYRYLLEMNVQLEGKEEVLNTSEYVYIANDKPNQLCHTSNFQWVRNADVHLVVSVKNLGPWIRHLIQNVEEIYAATHDEHFQLIIVDYQSADLDVEKELKQSSVPRWKVICKEGAFSRSQGLQAGIDYVQDDNSIVMTIDMHLTLPSNFIDAVRKHTVPGKMAYAPMFFRLESGYTELNLVGKWETLTYGLFGLYKKDWTTVGGFDLKQYTSHWGGEDWDVLDKTLRKGFEVFRLRPPGLVHYYHTRDGMWGSKNKGYGVC